ncbi:MAG TPA: SGNH/GDSL hydrolase family protein [Pyrinomonadaceae bacterium]|nr:SGNH/GDSL hydrolase family protein [Pyrinomonadaceae bacterium]
MNIPTAVNLAFAAGIAASLFSGRRGGRGAGFRRFRRLYRGAAVILLNTVVLLLAINVLLLIPIAIKDSVNGGRVAGEYRHVDAGRWAALERVYPGLSREEIQTLLNETYSPARAFAYEPFTEFRERPYAGRYVNVDAGGFRLTKGQGPWPPDREKYFNVFLFGGSTTFGFGVPDAETVASHLQTLLSGRGPVKEVRVYNFGRGSYYSTQERILFEKLVAAGFRPDVAVFIDGLNDSHHYDDRPSSAARVESALEGRPAAVTNVLTKVPMVRAALAAGRWLGVGSSDEPAREWAETPQDRAACGDEAVLLSVVNRYVENKRISEAVAAAYGVKTLFVWQPVAVYKYDQRYNLFAADDHPRKACVEGAYPLMAKFAAQHPLGDNFLWGADIQQGVPEPLYVDALHYSGKMSELFARSIADALNERALLPFKGSQSPTATRGGV